MNTPLAPTLPKPIPGTALLHDADVTDDMREWAQELLHDPAWPMLASTRAHTFGSLEVVARIEPHPPEPSIQHWHRGVTLYEVTGPLLAEGIDVSCYQRTVDWSLVREHKQFAFIKASEGVTRGDDMFASHWDGAAGMLRGAYHFLRPEADGATQADFFLSQLGDRAAELPHVLDVESDPHRVGPVGVARAVERWVARILDVTGSMPLIYTMPAFWSALPLAADDAFAGLWIAHWDVTSPLVPHGWSRWSFWQYSSKAGVAGIGADLDVDRFNGTADELLRYAGRQVAPGHATGAADDMPATPRR